jgi:hypothetical protein
MADANRNISGAKKTRAAAASTISNNRAAARGGGVGIVWKAGGSLERGGITES